MKKWVFVILIVFLTLSSLTVSLASGETITQDSKENSGNITVDYNAGVTYTVTIPASVTFSDTEKQVERSLQVSDVVLNEGTALNVNLASRNDFKMMNGDGYIAYRLMINYNDVPEGNNHIILTVPAGGSTGWAILKFATDLQKDHILYAGDYTDTLTFTVSID